MGLGKKRQFMNCYKCTVFEVSGEGGVGCQIIHKITSFLVKDSVYVLYALIFLTFLRNSFSCIFVFVFRLFQLVWVPV